MFAYTYVVHTHYVHMLIYMCKMHGIIMQDYNAHTLVSKVTKWEPKKVHP